MSSTRLPGKVLLDLAGQPMLVRVVERARRAATVDSILVATTTDPSDDPLAELCAAHGYPCYRGSLHDVLDRYYQAALSTGAGAIVRLTADCPVIDPQVIDLTVNAFRQEVPGLPGFDFAANRLPPPWGRSIPIGLDTEVCTFSALERAWRESSAPYQREHVMPYLYEDAHAQHFAWRSGLVNPASPPPAMADFFRVLLVHHTQDYGALRWTVDTPADMEFIRAVYARFPGRDDFSWHEILTLLEREPELAEINAGVQHKKYTDYEAPR